MLNPTVAIEVAERYAAEGQNIAAGVLCRIAIERHVRNLAIRHGIGQSRRMTANVVNALVASESLPKSKAVLIRRALGKASKAAHGVDLGADRTTELIRIVRKLVEDPRQGVIEFPADVATFAETA